MAGIEPTSRPVTGSLQNQLLTAIGGSSDPLSLYHTSLLQSLRQPATKSPATSAESYQSPATRRDEPSARSTSFSRSGDQTRNPASSASQSSRPHRDDPSQNASRHPAERTPGGSGPRNPQGTSGSRAGGAAYPAEKSATTETASAASEAPQSPGSQEKSARPAQEGGPPGSLTDSLTGSLNRPAESSAETDIGEDPALEQLLDEISASLSALAPQSQTGPASAGAETTGEETAAGETSEEQGGGTALEVGSGISEAAAGQNAAAEEQILQLEQQNAAADAESTGQAESLPEAAASGQSVAGQPVTRQTVHSAGDPAEEKSAKVVDLAGAELPVEANSAESKTAAPTESNSEDSGTGETSREQRTDRTSAENTSDGNGSRPMAAGAGVPGSGQTQSLVNGPSNGARAVSPALDSPRTSQAAAGNHPPASAPAAASAGTASEAGSPATGSRTQVTSPAAAGVAVSDSGAGAAAAETTSTIDSRQTELANRVAAALKQMRPGGSQLRILLHPEQLGDLRIELQQKGGELTARLEVQTAEAQQLLTEQLSQLRDSLSRRGMKIDSIQIELGPRKTGDLPEQQRQQGSHQQHEGGRQGEQQQQGSARDQSGRNSRQHASETDSPDQTDRAAA
ncbi:MAG: flagellar hook-length control protein FliK [Planctomycetaceae bacterium]|nr:flagellar hook-length control protein FliK [Planctomycetaceae bacterium]